MPGSDVFDVTFNGIGGHGSSPHLAKDPVIMGATAILEYQTIVNRSISAQNPHVITVGSMVAGSTNNVIPSSAILKVNLRWFNWTDRMAMIEGINRVDSSIAFANNLPAELYPSVVMKGMVYPVRNDTALVNKINGALSLWVPADQIISRALPMMVSEDFPYLVMRNKNNTPYDFLQVGIADPELCRQAKSQGKQFPFFNHNPNFVVDLSALPYGTAVGASALLGIFGQSASSR
jgi:hippurate hydrolase